jgi:hypothetical protein
VNRCTVSRRLATDVTVRTVVLQVDDDRVTVNLYDPAGLLRDAPQFALPDPSRRYDPPAEASEVPSWLDVVEARQRFHDLAVRYADHDR